MASFCKFCGASLEGGVFCPQCGGDNRPTNENVEQPRETQTYTQTQEPQVKVKKSKTGLWVTLGVVGVALITTVVLLIVFVFMQPCQGCGGRAFCKEYAGPLGISYQLCDNCYKSAEQGKPLLNGMGDTLNSLGGILNGSSDPSEIGNIISNYGDTLQNYGSMF